MKVNTTQFLVAISHNIKLGTAETNGTFANIAKAIKKVIGMYKMGGFWCKRSIWMGNLKAFLRKIG